MRILVVTAVPTPYRDPFWESLSAQPGIELDVVYCARRQRDSMWSSPPKDTTFRVHHPKGLNLLSWRGPSGSCYWNPGISRIIDASQPDVLVAGGYNHLTLLAAMRCAWRKGIPYYLMCESHNRHARPKHPLRALKPALLSRILAHASGALPAGQRAQKFLTDHGVGRSDTFRLPNVAPPAPIGAGTAPPSPTRNYVFVGRLIPQKRCELLVEAFLRHAANVDDVELHIIGEGTEAARLRAMATTPPAGPRIRFIGPQSPTEVRAALSRAHALVNPGSETWSVACCEAAAAGAHVILSDEVGCGPDLAEHYAHVRSVAHGDVDALCAALRRVDACARPGLEGASTLREVWSHTRLSRELAQFLRTHHAA